MNEVQFNALMALLQKAGDGASSAFIWWIVSDKIVPYIAWFTFGVMFVLLGYKLIKTSNNPNLQLVHKNSLINAREAVRSAWLYGTTGTDENRALHKIYVELRNITPEE